MRPFVYIVVLLIALLVFKAFFLDAYLAERKASDANASESNATVLEEHNTTPAANVPGLKTSGIHTEYNRSELREAQKEKPSYSDMPLEKVGDSIADKLGEKL